MITQETNAEMFWQWLKSSDGYKDNFTYKGAEALFNYIEDYSNESGENINFDPIDWCCNYSEYKNLADLQHEYREYNDMSMEDLIEKTAVIPIEGTEGFIIENF